ncbi:MAG: protein-disulfide reductase DsbD N-terminal domain-containing protein [Chitinophagaceae bacterium]|nr:protein-disulfide reductase DsbD N-terminal domain-containing protein [Chitinophagaceae bacterium]
MMKNILLLIFILPMGLMAQMDPVQWSFSATKVGDKTYEVKLVATLQKKWHLYSQTQPKDAIILPTTFRFNPNPLITLEGKVKEIGKLEKFYDKTVGASAYQYSNSVTFVQRVKIKSNAKTKLIGSVQYQTCDDERCLPPKTVSFSVELK